MANGGKLIKCENTTSTISKCESEFQDTQYGKGIRVATIKDDGKCVCTTCGKEQVVKGDSQTVDKKNK